jgi:hypothetical protein
MRNGGLSGVGAGSIHLPAAPSAGSAGTAKQVASETPKEAAESSSTTGRALHVAA